MQTILAEARSGAFSTTAEANRRRDELIRAPAATAEPAAADEPYATSEPILHAAARHVEVAGIPDEAAECHEEQQRNRDGNGGPLRKCRRSNGRDEGPMRFSTKVKARSKQ